MMTRIFGIPGILGVLSLLQAAPLDLQSTLSTAIARGDRQLVLPPGDYRASVPAGGQAHVTLTAARDLKVVADGVRLICTEPRRALELKGCTNVEITGLVIDYDPLPFTQATVTSVDGNDGGFDLAPHAGYPPFPDREGELYLFGPDGRWKVGAWSGGRKVAYENRNGGLHVVLDQSTARHGVEKGDKVVQKLKTTMPHVVLLSSSTECTFRAMTIHTGPTFAVCDTDGDANRYLGVRITPGPKPLGAAEPRLMANLADGIHCISARRGPRIEGCLIEGHSDDGVAIHGKYQLVLEAAGSTVRLAAQGTGSPFSAGETVRLTSGVDGTIRGEAKVLAIVAVPGDASGRLESLKNAMKLGNKNLYTTLRSYWEVMLDRNGEMVSGDVLDCPGRSGSGFVVQSNTIRNHRARGILVKASDGLIEGNLIDHSSIAGIVVAPEISWWLEAGYSWNLRIIGNRVVDCGYEHPNPGHVQGGSISVAAAGMSKGVYAPAGGQRNIQILSNTVERCKSVNLLVTSGRDILVQGNRFIRPLEESWPNSTVFGVSTNTLFWVENTERISFVDNSVEKPGPHMAAVLGKGTNVTEGAPMARATTATTFKAVDIGPSPWQASKGFSGIQGNRGWSYAAFDGKTLSSMVWNEGKKQWEGPGSYCHVYAGAQHPGTTHDSVREWRVPRDGNYRLTGAPKAGNTSDGVLLSIHAGTEVLWSKEVNVEGRGIPHPHDLKVALKAGQTVSFRVGRRVLNNSDYTAWDPVIESIP